MILTIVAFLLRIYFSVFLGVSGLAKIDRPFVELGQGLRGLLFSSLAGRLLGAFEVALAFLLASGLTLQLAAVANATLFGLFLLFRLYLIFTRQGSQCGCFGAHELIATDLSSLIVSSLIFGQAVILAILTQRSTVDAWNLGIAIIFFAAFGLLGFMILVRRRSEKTWTQAKTRSTLA